MIQVLREDGRYRVQTPGMALELRADGRQHGIVSLRAAGTAGQGQASTAGQGRASTAGQGQAGDGHELVRERLFLLNVYRLLCTGRLMAIARDEPFEAALEGQQLVIRWQPTEAHPARLTAAYTTSAPDTIDVDITVTAERDVPDYEVLTSSYFDYSLEPYAVVPARPGRPPGVSPLGTAPGTAEPADLRFFRLERSPFLQGHYVLLGRDLEAVRTRLDGRYNNTGGHPVARFVAGPPYALPVGVMGNDTRHVVQLAIR